MQCIILQTEITLIISRSGCVLLVCVLLCVWACVCVCASIAASSAPWFVDISLRIHLPGEFSGEIPPPACLFHLLVIHNNFLDVEIIALESQPSPRKRQETNIKLWWKELAIKAEKRHRLSNVQIRNEGGPRWVIICAALWLEGGESSPWRGGKCLGGKVRKRGVDVWSVDLRQLCQEAVSDKLSLKWNYLLDGGGVEFVGLCILDASNLEKEKLEFCFVFFKKDSDRSKSTDKVKEENKLIQKVKTNWK